MGVPRSGDHGSRLPNTISTGPWAGSRAGPLLVHLEELEKIPHSPIISRDFTDRVA